MRPPTAEPSPPLERSDFDFDDSLLWVMHCAEGPVPLAAARAAEHFWKHETQPWTLSWKRHFLAIPRQTRANAAALVSGREEDISLVPTTSAGLVAVAQGYPWQDGDEVLLPAGEFPSNAWPWLALRARGVSVRQVPLWPGHQAGARAWQSTAPGPTDDPEQRLLEACGPRTRVLAASWVRFQDGLRLDLRTLAAGCAERGIDLVIDGVQGVGTLPVELEGLAAFASGGHKGLLAPQGQGFLWTAPELRQRLVPTGSWLSVEDSDSFDRPSTDFDRDWLRNGERLEAGSPNLLSCAALAESLRLLVDAGPQHIAAHVRRLQLRLLAGLSDLPGWRAESERLIGLLAADRLGSIVALHHGDHGQPGLEALLQAGFQRGIYASVREGYLRIALHGWHSSADIDRLLDWLAADTAHASAPAML